MRGLMYSALGLLMSSDVFACAVCGVGDKDPTIDAYTSSTAMLSVVPLVAIGGIIFTIYRYVKKSEEK